MAVLKKLKPYFLASAMALSASPAQADPGFDTLLRQALHDQSCLSADLSMLAQAVDASNVPAVPPIVGRVEHLVHHLERVTAALKSTFKYKVGSLFYNTQEKEKRAALAGRLNGIEKKMQAHPGVYDSPLARVHALRAEVARAK